MNPIPSIALCAIVMLPSCNEHALAGAPPNLVLISLDTLRADHLGTYGYRRDTSPNIDALAERSIVFEACYSQSPKTAPSHMSILTGVVPDMHGVKNWEGQAQNIPLSVEIPTMASILRDRGYETAAITAGGHMVEELGFDRGFEGNFATTSDYAKVFELGKMALESYADRPFFLFLHTYEVHDPYTPPDEYRNLFADPDYAGPIISSRSELAALGNWSNRHAEFWKSVEREQPEVARKHLVDLYDGSIRYADTLVAGFLSKLEALGLTGNTVVILLSDHGEEFGEHGGYRHEQVYQELLHVPLILSLPEGVAGGRQRGRIRETVRLIDVLPTVLELTDTPMPEHVQGRSLLELLAGAGGDRSVFSTWPRVNAYAYRNGPDKLIEKRSSPDAGLELYALEQDAGEQVNRLASPTPRDRETLTRLRGELDSIRSASELFREALTQGMQVELDPEQRAALQALGYVK
jgi:arylsulfatase A-like enzyme